ncbi:hypothetical protein FRC09_018825, partial [Ceratobasidium sp. 395]
DIVFVLVVRNSEQFPGGYHLLVFSNMIDGLLGGFSTAIAISHAYVSDCVPSTERVRHGLHHVCCLHIAGIDEPGSPTQRLRVEEACYVTLKDDMFFPRVISRSGARKRRDWNPTFIGLAFALHATNSGSYSFKYQYALKAFAWSSTQMGNWLSLLGFTRALHLVVILPLILKGLHWYRERTASTKESVSTSDPDSKAKDIDLLVARASIGVDVTSYTASALVTTSAAFVGTSSLLSFGGGYGPAIQSLALSLTQNPTSETKQSVNPTTDEPRYEGASIDTSAPDDTGRLLGAMSVVHALCSQILGPSLFGMTFVATVASLPRAIFWLSAALNVAALISLLCVRLAPAGQSKDDAEYVLLNNMED